MRQLFLYCSEENASKIKLFGLVLHSAREGLSLLKAVLALSFADLSFCFSCFAGLGISGEQVFTHYFVGVFQESLSIIIAWVCFSGLCAYYLQCKLK